MLEYAQFMANGALGNHGPLVQNRARVDLRVVTGSFFTESQCFNIHTASLQVLPATQVWRK